MRRLACLLFVVVDEDGCLANLKPSFGVLFCRFSIHTNASGLVLKRAKTIEEAQLAVEPYVPMSINPAKADELPQL